MARLRIPNDTAAAVTRGHPWVFRDRPYKAPPGALVELTDDNDRLVGWGLADDGPIAVRVLGKGPAPKEPFANWLEAHLLRCDRFRHRIIFGDTDAYRVVAGEGDGLSGLVIDRYAKLAVVRLYSSAWTPWLDTIVRALNTAGWAETVFRRLGVARVDGRDGGETLFGPEPAEKVVVSEHGMKMLVRPYIGQKTGLFLDQREHRAMVRQWANGRTVANLFAYNGGFSVSAVLGGASRVVTVDLAPEAIADAKENFQINGINPDDHGFEVADVFEWRGGKTPFELMIVDPPSLAHDKNAEAAARRAYRRLHAQVGPMVARDGLLATSSCTARLGLDPWRQIVAEGLSASGDWSWHWISAEPPDHPTALAHPEGRYLKFALLRRR